MSKSTISKAAITTSDLDPATLARVLLLQRQRELANRKLLKRRRQKSGQ